jgi:hypothetical protein
LGNKKLEEATHDWRSVKERLFFGAHTLLEPLLPDCSSVLRARPGTVEGSFRAMVPWYSLWLISIHTNDFTPDALLELKKSILQFESSS